MAFLNISAAARATGKDRGTINRYLKSGRLSGVVDTDGRTKIDTSELIRVFGELAADGSVQQSTNIPQTDSIIVAMLKEQLNAALDREKSLLSMLEQEQQARRELEQRFIALPDGKPKQHGLFARLFGRA